MWKASVRKQLPNIVFSLCFIVAFVYFLSIVPKMNYQERVDAGAIAIVVIILSVVIYGSVQSYFKERKQKTLDKFNK
jgi:hypothetical protein